MEETKVIIYGLIALAGLVFLIKLLSSNKELHLSSNSFWWVGKLKIINTKDSFSKNKKDNFTSNKKNNPRKNRQYRQCPHCQNSIRAERFENHVKNKCAVKN